MYETDTPILQNAAEEAPGAGAGTRTLFEERIRQLYESKIALMANAVNAAVISVIAYGELPTVPLGIWLATMWAVCLARIFLIHAYRTSPTKYEESRKWARLYTLGSGTTGLIWAAAAPLFFLSDAPVLEAMIAITIGGMTAGALATAATHLPAFLAFMVPANFVLMTTLAWQLQQEYLALAAMVMMFAGFLIRFARNWNLAYVDSLETRMNSESMIGQMRITDSGNQMILEAAGEGIYGLDTKGRVTFVNPAAARIVGYTPKELIGLQIHDLIHHSHEDGTPYPIDECPMYASCTDGTARQTKDEVLWRKDGSSFPVEYKSTPLMRGEHLVGAVITFSDITDAKRAEESLRESEEQLRLLTDSLPVLIAAVDADTNILFANQTCSDWYARPAASLAGHSVRSIMGPALDLLVRRAVTEGLAGMNVTEEILIEFPDGVGRVIEFNFISRFDDENNLDTVYVLGVDISLRQQMERQKLRLLRETRLRELGAEISSAARAEEIGQMSSVLAHELNQPLTAISNYLSVCRTILDKGGPDAATQISELFGKAVAQADRAGVIIQGVRELVRSGRVEFAPEPINEVISEACELALPGDGEREGRSSIKIDFHLADDLPLIPVSRVQMQQVIVNLLRNALAATENIGNPHITISTKLRDPGHIKILIDDNGPGFPEEIRSECFSPFVTTKDHGMGIGLAICRSIVEAHGGELNFGAGPLGGACLSIELPTSIKIEQKPQQRHLGAVGD